ncbi:MAG: hypothetical protein K6V73_02065 [Firmicutes bacterium]|nr:hypothetical protein [Bacillota bacterium]
MITAKLDGEPHNGSPSTYALMASIIFRDRSSPSISVDHNWEPAPRLVTDRVKSAIDRAVFLHIPPFGYSQRPLLQTFANNAAYTIQPWMREEEAHIVRLRGRPPR